MRRPPRESRVRRELAARRDPPSSGARSTHDASPAAGVERRIARMAKIVRIVDLCIVPVAFGVGAKLLVDHRSAPAVALGAACIAAGLVAGWLALDDDGVL